MSETPMQTTVPGRECGECALCCKLLDIKALEKPAGEWCPHCSSRKGCDIYLTRPDPCRSFHCGWMLQEGISPEWYPIQSRMIITFSGDGQHLFALVDPARPDAWKKAPYYQQLKNWARINNARGQQIIVSVNRRYIVIYPDREEDLGTIGDDETVTFEVVNTPTGPVTQARKAKMA